ncbi:hypothetical protein ABT340_02670 [Streptosporangium sp. NPDC000239]|uniref:hypothetical protein n=1 Tax=Streptosporangium sp. NPDC000239 TaxID=3154248 RepID=UPI003323B24F
MVTCPHCFARLRPGRIEFRCVGASGRRGGCDPEPDEVLARHLGSASGVSLPPAFAVPRPGSRAECPRCHRPTGRRVCPRCHGPLPAEYCRRPGRIVALVGAKGSGKSTYLTVLLHELANQVGEELNTTLMGCDERTIERYRRDFARPLYEENRLLGATRSAETEPGGPLVYLLSRTVWSFDRAVRLFGREFRIRWDRTRSLALVLFDAAGEDLRSRDRSELYLSYLGAADGVVVLLDPLGLPGAGPPVNGDPGDDPLDVLARVTELLRERHRSGWLSGWFPRRLRIPVAVALSKIDALRPEFGRQSALHRARPRTGRLDLDDREAVHEQVRALLDRWQAGAIDRYLGQHYTGHALFGLSALGGEPDLGTGRVGPGGVRPYRVEDPLLWLLYRFGILRAGR